jgi:hypothetical protein
LSVHFGISRYTNTSTDRRIGVTMDVCKECHERDLLVTNCVVPLYKHMKWGVCTFNTCDICGTKTEPTYHCSSYRWHMSYMKLMKASGKGA